MSDKPIATPNAEAAAEESRAITVSPRIDILETDQELLVHADMPGVKTGDVDVRFENGELSVHGRRNVRAWDNAATNYFRSFRITERIATDKIEAQLKNGVLTLKLPKVEAVKPRRIAVKG
jgi:HSP20 family protein